MAKLRENGFALALAAGLALALLVGIVYSISASGRDVASHTETLHAAHETIQAAIVARGQVELAAYQTSLLAQGVAVDESTIDAAAERAAVAINDAVASHGRLVAGGTSSSQLVVAFADFTTAGAEAIDGFGARAPIATAGFDAAYEKLMSELTTIRSEQIAAVSRGQRSDSLASAVAGFLAVFVIPAAVIATYFVLDRRRRRQHELEVALEAERAALQSRERFLMTVSQELRKPLTGVRAIAQMLAADEALMDQPRMADLHALLVGELDDMSGVVEDLLTTSRLEAGALEYAIEPVQVREEVRSLLDSLNHRGASVYLAMDEGVVNADRRRFRQMVRNLVVNALKYGGPNIEIKGQADSDSYTVLVIDDGHGVPGAVEDKLFARFTHSGEGPQSVGLGLSIVMALAIGMGGTAFHQREDGLTRFGMRLPNAVVATAPEPSDAEAAMVSVSRAAG